MDGYAYESGLRSQIVSGKSGYGWSQRYGSDVGTIPGEVTRSSHSGAAVGKPWSFGDPEAKRKKRIARYKVYAIEGKVKATLRNGMRWIKDKCSRIVHGY
ncbi:unnamed protein product [Lupinus luteus]|uniref:DUF3511 domain-containing protein n=1 Tax=Lupinus luteus TaxID=3873 RepID=A0AAV1VTD4_LUPLU